ncbi:MAG: reprolysin-like metallopeptidase [Saprospiraceae bacterium]
MNWKTAISLFALLGLFACSAMAQVPSRTEPQPANGFWSDVPEVSLRNVTKQAVQLPGKFRLLEVEIERLADWLAQLPLDGTSERSAKPSLVITLPMPDGGFEDFVIVNDPVMHPELARQFPEIQTFSGYAVNDPATTVRLDVSPQGFNAQILSDKRDAIYIAPVTVGDNRHCLSFFKKEAASPESWRCLTEGLSDILDDGAEGMKPAAGDCRRRVYRLAMACTGEYAANVSAPNPPTVLAAMTAINASVNVVNGIYQSEFGIFLQLVPNNNLVVFLDPATDGYTNGNVNTMASQNQGRLDAIITAANYDIGHVIGTTLGLNNGVVLAGARACNGQKAQGATAGGTPQGAVFNVDFLAHEIGHQFSAGHTYNAVGAGSCSMGQLVPAAAFEPGSGSTIMAYAGICNPVNVQPNSDPYFHAFSLQQVAGFVAGAGCGTLAPVTNDPPTANAGADFTIPVRTPFRLTATGGDPNGNPLTFCWEQMDNQQITHPPAATAANGPVFRSFLPRTSPTRYFPRLPVILDNTLPSTWEVLPNVARTMNFRATVRDNVPASGCTAEDDMVVTFSASAGPFRVTGIGPDDNCLFADASTTVTWDVANTTAAPVSCANVDIWLSTDGGQNFGILLANDVPNSGSASVNIPATAITQSGRIMVICSDNIFLNINQKDIAINCPANITVTDNPAQGVYQARTRIVTSGTVVVSLAVPTRFFAGEDIVMTDGFWAPQGSDFIARLQTCDHCTGTKPEESLSVEKENPKVYFYEGTTGDRSENEQGAGEVIASVSPNPFTQQLTVEFLVRQPGKVVIQLLDFAGRLVQEMYQNDLVLAGRHRATLPAHQLPSGVYSCRVVLPDGQKQMTVVKVD